MGNLAQKHREAKTYWGNDPVGIEGQGKKIQQIRAKKIMMRYNPLYTVDWFNMPQALQLLLTLPPMTLLHCWK